MNDADDRSLLSTARRFSLQMGHQEIILPVHLLAAVLAASSILAGIKNGSSTALKVLSEMVPPWESDAVVLSPGGQTPGSKRVIRTAMEFADKARESLHANHLWNALREHENELVDEFLYRIDAE